MLRARLAPLLALALAGGCSGDPSFSVRWRLGRNADSLEDLFSVAQCTELGISRVQVTTLQCDGECTEDTIEIIDEREFPCFPRGFEDAGKFAPGPEVGPGRYVVTAIALGRRGVPFFCPADGEVDGETDTDTGATGDAQTCTIVAAAAAGEIVIEKTGQNLLIEADIVGAPECGDGIDNDRDGYTDLADASCRGDWYGSEVSDSAAAQIIVRPSLLGGNPNADCVGLGLRDIDLDIVGPTTLKQRFGCTTTPQTFTQDLEPGDYQLSISGVGYDDSVIADVALDPALTTFTLPPSGFQAVELPADFAIESFHAPIEAGFSFSLEYLTEPDTLAITSCTPVDGGVVLDGITVTLVDQSGQAVTGAALVDFGMPSIPLDGTPLPCTDMLKIRAVEPLMWGPAAPMTYSELSIVVEAFPAGSNTACYSNADAPVPVAPNASIAITVPRVSDQGDCADS